MAEPQQPPMLTLEQRIASRNEQAEHHLAGKGLLERTNGKLHLAYANTLDRINTFTEDHDVNAVGGGMVGAARGFLLGAAVYAVGLTVGVIGGAAFLPIMLTSTVGLAAYQSIKSYNEALASDGEIKGAKHADEIARDAGAIPARDITHNMAQAQKASKGLTLPNPAPQLAAPASALTLPAASADAAPSHVEALKYRMNTEKSAGHSR